MDILTRSDAVVPDSQAAENFASSSEPNNAVPGPADRHQRRRAGRAGQRAPSRPRTIDPLAQELALSAVAPALKMLIKLNSNQDCEVIRFEKMDGEQYLIWRLKPNDPF
jgi:hypothetical protein